MGAARGCACDLSRLGRAWRQRGGAWLGAPSLSSSSRSPASGGVVGGRIYRSSKISIMAFFWFHRLEHVRLFCLHAQDQLGLSMILCVLDGFLYEKSVREYCRFVGEAGSV